VSVRFRCDFSSSSAKLVQHQQFLLTLFPCRNIVCFETVGTSTRQHAACLVEGSASLHIKRLDAGCCTPDPNVWGRDRV